MINMHNESLGAGYIPKLFIISITMLRNIYV